MRRIKIVADSSADTYALSGVDFAYAPLKIGTAEREFVDDESLDTAEMVEYLYRYKGKSKSACPNVGDWLMAFGDAEDVFAVTITSGLSGSYNSALVAKATYESENEGRRVCVIDSLSTGPESRLIIEKLKEYLLLGLSFEEISERIKEYQKKTGLLFMLGSLRNLANNGRVSPIVAKIVGIAGIFIIGKASDEGTLENLHKPRGERRALETMIATLAAEGYRGGKVSIGHCLNEAAAERIADMIRNEYPDAEIEIHPLGGLCSFYAEKGGVLIGFEKA